MTLPVISPRNWPLKAYKNLSFLNSDPARNIRVLCEMTERGLRFAVQNIEDTIVLFRKRILECRLRFRCTRQMEYHFAR